MAWVGGKCVEDWLPAWLASTCTFLYLHLHFLPYSTVLPATPPCCTPPPPFTPPTCTLTHPHRHDFLLNSRNLGLGTRQNGQPVGDVQLPPWAASPSHFQAVLRAALEAPFVSANLHHWCVSVADGREGGQGPIMTAVSCVGISSVGRCGW